jgi:hypothetical protein
MKNSSKSIRLLFLFVIWAQYSNFYAQQRTMTIVTSPNWWVKGSPNIHAIAAIPTIFTHAAIETYVTNNLGIPSNGLIWSARDYQGPSVCCDAYNFVDTFRIPCTACIDSARYWIEADDTMSLKLNGTLIAQSDPRGWLFMSTGTITPSLFNTTTELGRNILSAYGADGGAGPRYIAMRMRIYYRICLE